MPDPPGSLLVIDDDASNLDMLSRRLRRKGFDVATGIDGEQALSMVEAGDYDLILLDVMMPGLDGFEVLRILRQSHAATDLPVIMATAKGESEDIVHALGLGANDYVTKPLDFPVVLARVHVHLALKRSVERVRLLERSLAARNRELERVNSRLASANGRMLRDLKAAAKVQESLLPRGTRDIPGLAFAWAFRPSEELAGDGLNVVDLGGARVGLYVLDVSGHGVASSLLSVSLSRRLGPPGDPSSILVEEAGLAGPARVAQELDRLFPFDPATEQYATLAYGLLDANTREFRYVCAGHPPPAMVPALGKATILEGRGYPIGLAEGTYEEQTLTLSVGDRLFLYSDGIPEALGPDDSAFGLKRLLATVEEARGNSLEEAVLALRSAVEAWCGAAGVADDVSVVAVEVRDLPSESSATAELSQHPEVGAGSGS